MSLLVPSAACRTFVPLPDYAECDPEFRLAQPAPLIEPPQNEFLVPPDIPSIDTPWLAAWRRTRQLPDPFSLLDPEPASFAEAGGPHGPRLGPDAGGESLSFLPVGGFGFHHLKPEWETPEMAAREPPGAEEYEAVRSAAGDRTGPLDVDAWRKESAAESRLVELADSGNKAVRDRFVELNGDLARRNKLFLG